MYEEEKAKLREKAKYVVNILRPSDIRVFMHDYLDKGSVEQILSVEEQTSVTAASEKLIERICLLDSPGWFQNFLDTLLSTGYSGLHAALQQWDFSPLESTREHRVLLERIEPSFTRNINPSHLLPHLRDCLTDRECEEIQKKQEQYGAISAAMKLTDCFRRSDCTTWYKQLKTALYECEFTIALQLINGDDESSKTGSEGGEEGEDGLDATTATFSIHYREASEEEEGLLKSCNPIGEEASAAEGSGDAVVRGSGGEKKLRQYQTELAQPVYEGNNTIICAPTGCGKTVVALAISERHLATSGEGSKVVFLATKVEVYYQQLKLFTQHFRERDQDIRIQGMCGEQDQLSLSIMVESSDIIILTPQILVNSLCHGDLPSLSCFSLIIFDECHNTTGKHPYNIIMRGYLDAKLGNTGEKLPQIVGLTASVGIGSFKNQQEAEDNICQLCANLDTQVISTVQDSIEELNSFVHTPEKEFVLVMRRQRDAFTRIICDIMKRIETLAKDVYDIDGLSPILNRDYGSQKYEQWIVDVQKRCLVLRLDNQAEESRVCRALYNYTEHLRRYNDALIIHEDADMKDALDFLSAFIEQVKNAGHGTTERLLTQFFDAHVVPLRELISGDQYVNPKLSELQFILQEKYRAEPDTRTILFVRTRALADALKRWMEETDCLKHLKPGVLIGRRGRPQNSTSGRMTLNSQKGVLESFKSTTNESKLLIATSVADEGIDIPTCNLVLMYEYVGNVVKMVQVRGRGRAQGSVCILISNKEARIDKEKMNVNKEKLVKDAINQLQKTPDAMRRQMRVLQREDKVRRDQERLAPERPRVDACFSLLCAKCKDVTACVSDDIRVLGGSHHVVVNRSLFSRAATKPHPRPITVDCLIKTRKLLCGKCAHDWGVVATIQNIPDLPVIKINSFVVEDKRREPKRLLLFKKWKDVTFSIKTFNITDIPDNWTPLPDDQ